MTGQEEVRWEYERVALGQRGPDLTINVTEDLIKEYATAVRHVDSDDGRSTGEVMMGLPTMAIRGAPLRRHDIANNNGFVSLEKASIGPRQTPFAKCEVRWFNPVRAGDAITSYGEVIDKYERRGNKFVTFRIRANNQEGKKITEYDYTCIFEYAKGQKTA